MLAWEDIGHLNNTMPTAPYDTLESILNAARVRLNDAIASLGGDVLKDIAVFTPQIVNNAWRRLQELLANYGFAALNREAIFASVPAVVGSDYGIQVWFNWASYFDGSSLQSAPLLPQDMIAPLDLFERVHGTGTVVYTPMDQLFNGLPTVAKQALNRVWEWRQETVYMPGAIGLTDLRLRYAAYLADFNIGAQATLTSNIDNATTSIPVTYLSGGTIANAEYFQIDNEIFLVSAGGNTATLTVATRPVQGSAAAPHIAGAIVTVLPLAVPVPIMRSLNSFAWFVCSEMAKARGDMDAGTFDQMAAEAAQQIFNRDPRQGKSIFNRAEYNRMQNKYTPVEGPAGPRGGPKE